MYNNKKPTVLNVLLPTVQGVNKCIGQINAPMYNSNLMLWLPKTLWILPSEVLTYPLRHAPTTTTQDF